MSLDKAIDAKHSLSGKILSIFLSLVLVVGFMPLPARAYADDEVQPVAVSDESGGESAQSVADVPDGAPAAGDESSDVGGGGEEPVTPAPAATPDEGSSEGSDVGGAPSDGGEAGGEGGEAAPTDTPSGSGVEGSSDVTNPQGADTPGTADVTEGNGNTAPEGTGEGAEGDGDGQEGEPTRDVTYVAQIGEMGYESLEAAIAAAQDGQTIVLLQDINLTDSSAYTNNRIPITHSITIDGGNHTVTVINRGFGVGEGAANSVMLDVVFKNITINNASSGARCIDTRGHINSLTLDHVTLSTQGGSGYTQPLTIGGNQASVATIIITNSTIETNSEGTAYYAIITFNPVNMTITNSTIKGWACIYAKGKDSSAGSAGSVFTITGSTLVSKNVYSGTSNAFSMFMAEDNNVKFVVTNSRLEVTQTGDQCQAIVSAEDFTGVVAKLGEGNTVTFTGEKATFVSNDAEAEITGGRFNKAVPEEYLADGFELVSNSDGTYSVAEKTYAAKIGETKYATFEDAVAAANGMTGDVTIELLGNVTWTTGASHGSTPLLTADSACTSLTINGNGHTLTAVGQGIGSLRAANGGTLNFNNMTIKDESVSYAENSWEHGYLEFGGKLTFTNVDFVNAIMLTQDNGQQEHCDATFTNCSFNSNAANEYDIWVSQGDATFIDCEFTGYRGAKTHEAYGSEVGTLTFKQCSFENLSKKPGLAVGTVNADTTVIFDSCTFDNVQAGDQGLYILESDTNLADYNLEFYNSAKVDGVEALAARIGNRGYLTVEEGFAAVKAGETLEILKAGTYSLPSSIANITVKGNVDGVVFNHTGTGSIASIPNGATFENVTFNFGTENYHGFQHAGTITMKDCTINGKFFSYGDMVFEGCTFNAPSGDYSMWAYAGNLTYTNCTFNAPSGKFINVYNEDGTTRYTITATGCTFNNSGSASKAAFNVKETCGAKDLQFTVNITNCGTTGSFPEVSASTDVLTVISGLVQVDDRRAGGTDNGGEIVVNVNDEQVYITPAISRVAKIGDVEYKTLQDALDAAYEMTGDVTITLIDDVEGYAIVHQKAGLNLTIDGANKTITGQIIVDGDGRASGTETLTIKNVNFKGDTDDFISGTDSFILVPSTKDANKPYSTGKYNYAHNVTVKDCSFESTSSAFDVVGFKATSGAGAYNVTLDGVTATNLHSLAQFTGTTGATITNCTVTGGESGVNIDGGTGDYIFTGNTFVSAEGADGYGIRLKGSSSATVRLDASNTLSANNALVLGKNDAPSGQFVVTGGTYTGHIANKMSAAGTGKYVISGGTFTESIPQEYIVEGYRCFDNGDGTYTVAQSFTVTFVTEEGIEAPEAQYVAAGGKATKPADPVKTGYFFNAWTLDGATFAFTTPVTSDITLVATWTQAMVSITRGDETLYYKTLKEAVTASVTGDTLVLLADLSRADFISYTGKTIAIDLNGHTYARTNSGAAIQVGKNAALTIIDSVGGGVFRASNGIGIETKDATAVVTIESGSVIGSTTGINADNATVVVNGGTVKGETLIGIRTRSGNITVNGGAIIGVEQGILDYENAQPATITVTGGSISCTGTDSDTGAIVLSDATTLAISGDAVIAGGYAGIAVFDAATVTVSGGTISGTTFGITGNGSEGYGGYNITVSGGAVSSESGVGIYHPNAGTVTVSGGTVTGPTGIYQKSGTLSVTGGEVHATGAAAEYSYNGNGANSTGDAIVVDSCGYPGGAPAASVTGGTVKSDNAKAVASYAYGENTALSHFVSGGLFSDELSADVVVEGKMAVASTTVTGMYEIADIVLTVSTPGNMVVGNTFKHSTTGIKINGTNATEAQRAEMTFASSDEAVFTVAADGTLTYTGAGTATLTVTYRGISAVATVNVKEADIEFTSLAGVVSYKTFSSTVVSASGTYKLLKDITATARIAPGFMASDVTIDLNGHTLTSTATDCGILLSRPGSASSSKKFALVDTSESKGGKFIAAAANGIQISGKYNDVTIGEGVTVEGSIAVLSENDTLTVAGTVNGGDDFAIGTNGSTTKNATINIVDGAVVTSDIVAMYLPGTGTTTISGGTVTGGTAIFQKSGNLVVTGGTIHGIGAATAFVHNPNGCNVTGDAIVVESCDYPGGAPTASITGGTIISDNANTVAAYAQDGYQPLTGFATGGAYGSDKIGEGVLEAGKGLKLNEADGFYYITDVFTVTFVTEDGVVAPVAQQVLSGNKAEKPVDTVKEGYVFQGWFAEGAAEAFDFNTAITENVTLTAQFAIGVAKIGDTLYTSLAAAVRAAADGDTVVLLKDTAESFWVPDVEKAITIDLGRHTMTGNLNIDDGPQVTVTNGTIAGTVNIYGSKTDEANHNSFTLAADATITASYGIILREAYGSGNTTGYGSTINIEGTVNGIVWVMGNIADLGSNPSVINVKNGAKITGNDVGIGLNGAAIVNVEDGATIIGTSATGTGIEVRAGKLVVNGGTITGDGTATTVSPNGSGTTTTGAGIAIAQHNTKLPIEVIINGGTITGNTAIYQSDPQGNEDAAHVSATINGGTFKGTEAAVYAADKETLKIEGGAYSDDSGNENATLPAKKYLKLDATDNLYKLADYEIVQIPAAATGLIYSGAEQTGVAAGEGYTLTGVAAATNAGEYTATATLAKYHQWSDGTTEAKEIAWAIAPASIEHAAVTPAYPNITYTGSAFEPSVTVYLADTLLVADTDYTVAYTDNTNVGTATITVTGKGNYTGAATAQFSILANDAGITVDPVAAQAYTGSPITPALVVKSVDPVATLVAGTDYTVVWSDNTEPGTASFTVQLKGNYSGSYVGSFEILAPVAQIGDTYYQSLSEAVRAAEDGQTVVLLKDTAESFFVPDVKKAITIDLGGHTMTGWLGIDDGPQVTVTKGTIAGTVYVYGSAADVAGYNSFTLAADATITSAYGIILYQAYGTGSDSAAYGSTINIEGTVNGMVWVMGNIVGQGTNLSVINVKGTVTGDDVGIALNGAAIVNVYEGATVTGVSATGTGIEVRAGELNVMGGTITGEGTATASSSNGSGTTTTGAGIAIAQHNTKLPIEVTISGGTITGNTAIYQSDPEAGNDVAHVSATITGGTFMGSHTAVFAAQPETIVINGGAYSDDSGNEKATLPEGKVLAKDSDGLYRLADLLTVTFDAKGGTPAPEAQSVVPGAAAEKPATDPSKTGTFFAGWTLNGEVYDFSTPVTENITLVASWSDAVAKIGDNYYGSLQAAFDAAQDGATIELLKDIEEEAAVFNGTGTVTLDLGGKTVTGRVTFNSGNVTVQNGTITGRVDAYDNAVLTLAADATVNGQVVVWGDGTAGQAGVKTPTLNVYGTVTNTGDSAISTNGSDMSGAKINIFDGASVTSTDEIAIYLPSGNLTISGGTITGTTAVYAKSGKLTISGGKLVAKGGKFAYNFDGNGANATGDALVIDNCNYPNGELQISITGGILDSANGSAIGSYASQGAEELTGFVAPDATTGFSDNSEETLSTLPTDKTLAQAEDGYWYLTSIYTVTFDADGGAPVPEAQKVVSGDKAAEPAAPAKDGFIFAGWFAPEATAAFDFANTAIAESLTLTAKWTQGVAKIGDVLYPTLAAAIAAAADGDTVELLADVTENTTLNGKDITIDLGGHTVTGWVDVFAGNYNFKNGTIAGTAWVYGSATDVAYSTITFASDVTINPKGSADDCTGFGVVLYQAEYGHGYGATINIDGTVNGIVWVMGNITELGSNPSTINVKGTINGDDLGIALNGAAIVNVYEGASVTGKGEKGTGIEVRAGKLTVAGGTIAGEGTATSVVANGSGTTTSGAGIAIAQHTTKLPVEVAISGGTVSGYTAIYQSDPEEGNDAAHVTATITGGTFMGTEKAVYAEQHETIVIDGGAYSDDSGNTQGTLPEDKILAKDTDNLYRLTDLLVVTFDADGGAPVPAVQKVAPGAKAAAPETAPTKDGFIFGGWLLDGAAYSFDTEVTENITLVAKWTLGVAKIGETIYPSLIAALAAAESGDTIQMVDDDATQADYAVVPAGMTVTLDLNGKTITSTSGGLDVYGNLTITDTSADKAGKIVATSQGVYVDAGGSVTFEAGTVQGGGNGRFGFVVENGAELTVSGGSIAGATNGIFNAGTTTVSGGTITAPGFGVSNTGTFTMTGGTITSTADSNAIFAHGASTTTISGGTVVGTDNAAISTNGSGRESADCSFDAVINITGGEVTSANEIGIYLPAGTLNISGGTITGSTAVYAKAGKLAITGGKLVANGGKYSYNFNGNGANATGDALVIDNCGYPQGVLDITITGGILDSAQANAIGSYASQGMEELTGFVAPDATTGFSDNSEETLTSIPEGKTLAQADDGYWYLTSVWTVTFDAAGGAPAPEAQKVVDREKASEPTAPTRDGYEFAGWFNGDAAYDFASEVTANLTLTAHWTELFTITFAGEGVSIEPITAKAGEALAAPADPTREGYKFAGWDKDFPAQMPAENLTLTAQWLKIIEVPTAVTGLVYNGSEQTGVAAGEGYTLTTGTATNAGSYTATATLAEGFIWADETTAAKEIAWSIAKADLSVADVDTVASMTYTGEALEPAVSVKINGTDVPAAEYTVAYANNVNVGTATVTVTAAEEGNYTGSASTQFAILVNAAEITVDAVPAQAYTGSAITPALTVKAGETVLVAGTDYDVVFSNNVEPGAASFTVQLKGNYSGSYVGTFEITAPVVSVTVGETVTYYTSLVEALAAAPDGSTVKMLSDDATQAAYAELAAGKTVTLDLNGKTVTSTSGGLDVYGNLTITDTSEGASGKIVAARQGVYVDAGGSVTFEAGTIEATNYGFVVEEGATLTMNGGTVANSGAGISNSGTTTVSGGTITTAGFGVSNSGTFTMTGGTITSTADSNAIFAHGASTTTISGGTVAGTDNAAISTNGSGRESEDCSFDAVINITGGEVVSANEIGIYLPAGTLNVSGGTITGTTGIYQKAGTLTVSGGTITGNGAKADYSFNGNGANATGDGIVVESCDYPQGVPAATISGGTITSANASSVALYKKDGTEAAGTIAINGGAYSDDAGNAYTLPEGKYLKQDESDGLYRLADYLVAQVPLAVTGLVYNGSEQTGVEAGEGYTLADNTATNAGEYTATATLAEGYVWSDENFDGKVTFEIAKAEVAVPVAVTGLVYNGSEQTGVAAGEGYTLAGNTATNAGDYTATATLADAANYKWADEAFTGSIAWSIAKAEVAVPTAVTGLVYNGEVQTGVAAGEGYTLTGNTATAAGDYTATATLDANHIWADGTAEAKEIAWSIAPAAVPVPVAVTGLVYNGSEQTGVAAGEGYTLTGNAATNAGDYTATATLAEGFVWTDASFDGTIAWSIAKADLSAGAVKTDPTSVSYTGEAAEPAVTVTLNGATVPADGYDVAYTDNVNVGAATATVTGKGNYTGSASTVFVIIATSIADAEATIPAQAYTGSAIEPAFDVVLGGKTLVKGTDYDVIFASNVEPGENTAIAIITGKGGYTGVKQVKWTILAAVASVTSGETVTYYQSLEEAMAAATDGSTVTLLADVTGQTTYSGDATFTLDLNGKTLADRLTINSGDVTIENGTINGRLDAYDNATVTVAADATVNGQIVVWGDGTAGEAGVKTPTLNVYGTVTNTGDSAISTNGTDMSGAKINIFDGASVTSTDEIAIYLPSGNLTVSGGTVTGATAVYAKSGSVAITGGKLEATGAAAEYSYSGDGANATGDALVIENCGYPNGAPTVTVTGGILDSANGNAVGSYAAQGKEELTGFVAPDATTGFSDNNEETLTAIPEGKTLVLGDDGYYYITDLITVTFDADGGEPVPAAQQVAKGGKAAKPETDPVKEGATFEGWFAPEATEAFDFANTAITEAITLTAHYAADVTVTFDADGGEPVPAAQQVAKGGKASKPETDPTKQGGEFLGWFAPEATEAFDFANTAITEDITLTAHWKAVPYFAAHSLRLDSEIGVKFKLAVPADLDLTGSYMTFEVSDGRSMTTVYTSEVTPESNGTAYRFTCYLDALELADTITATFHYGDGETVTEDYSAMMYFETAREKAPNNKPLMDLLDALQDYGHYFQQTGSLLTDHREHAPIPAATVLTADSIATATAGVEGMEIVKDVADSGFEESDITFALYLTEQTVVNVFIMPRDGVTVTSEYIDSTLRPGRMQISTPKIAPRSLDHMYYMTITTNLGAATVKVSALSYVYAIMHNQDNEAMKYAFAAYYNYFVAADAYPQS